MQIDTDGNKYDCRTSKDDASIEFTIMFNAGSGVWDVDCWRGEENRWHICTKDETKALFEFNRIP